MKILSMIIMMLFVMGTFAQSEDLEDSTYHEEQSWEDLGYSMYCDADSGWISPIVHFIAGPVDINCSTGEVVIAEGVSISAASIKFWRSLEAAYPYLFGENNGK